jgi:hypothetical protein
MRCSLLVAIALAATVMLLAASAAAVEALVKTPAKLYDNRGRAIGEVPAGSQFKAERLHKQWVYGYVRTRSGGRRGWIALGALDLDEAARRSLGATGTTESARETSRQEQPASDEPVLLRYRLRQGELQVYEVVTTTDVTRVFGPRFRVSKAPIMGVSARLVLTFLGKGRADDGSILAALQMRELDFTIAQRDAKTKSWAEKRFDREGMEVYDKGGTLLRSVRYGEGELADAPGMDWILDKPFEARLTDRLELREMTFAAGNEEYMLQFMGGVSLKDTLCGTFTYPEEPIKPGDSWEEEASQELGGQSGAGASLPAKLVGRILYTFTERRIYRDRPAVLIEIDGRLDPVETEEGVRISGRILGHALVDEATGIRIYSFVSTSMTCSSPPDERDTKTRITSMTTQRYKGNRYP